MIKALLKNGSYYFIAGIIGRATGLILFPLYARKLSPADYAVVDLLNVFAAFCAVTLSFEVTQGFYRYFNEYEDKERRKLTSTAFWFILISVSCSCVALSLFSSEIALWITGSSNNVKAVRYCTLVIWLSSLSTLGNCYLRLVFKSVAYLVTSLVQLCFTGATTVFAVFYLEMKGEGVFLGTSVGLFVGCLMLFYYIRKSLVFSFDLGRLREMLMFSFPLVPSSLGVITAMYIDRIVVKEMMTPTDVGLLGTAYRFSSLATVVTMAVSATVTPLIYKYYKEKNTPVEIVRVFKLLFFLTAVFTICSATISPEIIRWLFRPSYHPAGYYITGLMLATFMSQFYIFAPGLAIMKKTKIIALISILGACFNLVLNIVLVPKFGLSGVVAGTLLSSLAIFVLHVSLSQKYYNIPYPYKAMILVCFVCMMSCVVIFLLRKSNIPYEIIFRFCFTIISVFICIKLMNIRIQSIVR